MASSPNHRNGIHPLLLTSPKESLADFADLPWCRAIIADPSFTRIAIRDLALPRDSRQRTMVNKTLFTEDTMRSIAGFYKGFLPLDSTTRNMTKAEEPNLPEARLLFSLGSAMTGHADNLHGGVIALLLDEAMAMTIYAKNLYEQVNVTLKIEFKRSVPTPGIVLCRTWVEKVEGRKIWVQGILDDGSGRVYAKSESLFIRLKEEKL